MSPSHLMLIFVLYIKQIQKYALNPVLTRKYNLLVE